MFNFLSQVHLPEWEPRERGARDESRDRGREGRLKLKCEFFALPLSSIQIQNSDQISRGKGGDLLHMGGRGGLLLPYWVLRLLWGGVKLDV